MDHDVDRTRPAFGALEIVLLVTVVAMGILFWAYRSFGVPDVGPVAEHPREPTPALASVAVLPFEDLGGRAEEAYFTQGVSDQIRAVLARAPELHVASRTSSHALGGGGRSVGEIAQELGVRSILEGSVQRAGNRVRVIVSLVDVDSDRQLWTETYDRELEVESLFAVENEIARSVARALQVDLGETAAGMATRVPASLEAHDLYLLGLFHWNRRTGADMLRAAELFGEAVNLDPEYALARAGLAKAQLLLPLYADVRADVAMPEARAAAEAALELDPTLGEAYAALGLVQTGYDWDWQAAEASFQRALELNPRHATAHQWYGLLLDLLGRHEEARAHHRRALELDPLSAIINQIMGNHLTFVGEYDGAVRQLELTLELQPDFPLALRFLGHACLLAQRFDDGERVLRRWARVTGSAEEPWSRIMAGVAGPEGREAAVRAVQEVADAGVITPYWQAQYYALMGAEDELMDALRRGVESRDFLMFFVAMDPAFDPYRGDEAFTASLEPMNLP